MNGQVTFIIWRESVEALLVIGILAGWLRHESASRRAAWFLWGGVVAGLALALLFALTMLGFSGLLSSDARKMMMTLMVFIAAGLIVQMVMWMRAHGRSMKRDLEQGLNAAGEQRQWWMVFVLAALAVAREGSETVVFLYGTFAAARDAALTGAVASAVLGLFLAIATYGALQAGGRFLPWRGFFRVSEILLLLLGCALFTSGMGSLVGHGLLPYTATLWDSSAVLDDGGRIGGLVAGLTGYRATPDQVTLAAWIIYWGAVIGLLRLQATRLRLREA